MSQNKYPKAYEAYQQAVYRDGRNPTFWCSIGVLYYQINQYRDALDAYSRAIRLNPFISEVWYDLGTLVSFFLLSSGRCAIRLTAFTCSTKAATTKSVMPLTLTNELLSLILITPISKPDCSCFAMARPMVHHQGKLPCLLTSILRPTKLLALLARRVLSGLGPGRPLLRKDLKEEACSTEVLAVAVPAGVDGFLISTRPLSPLTLTPLNVNPFVAVPLRLSLDSLVPGRSSR